MTARLRCVSVPLAVLAAGCFSPPLFAQRSDDWYLRFPLPNRTAYSAIITSVFDHSMKSRDPYGGNGIVVAYTGERGEVDPRCDDFRLCNYAHVNGFPFFVNGQYQEPGTEDRTAYHLSYDDHPAYDFRTGGKIAVQAAAAGKAVACSEPGCVKIDHQNGYSTKYLHMEQRSEAPFPPAGTWVEAGTVIGIASDVGAEKGGVHLHFEVLKGDVPVDPYGWQGQYPDPWIATSGVRSENLWKPRAQAGANVRWHPDGALLTDGSTYWLLQGGRRRGIPDEKTFFAYGYDFANGVLAPESELACLPEGPPLEPPPEPRLIDDNGSYYELRGAGEGSRVKRGFPLPVVFQGQGFLVSSVQPGSVGGVPDDPYVPVYGSPFRDGALLREQNGAVWIVSNSKKTPFQTATAFAALGYRFDQVAHLEVLPAPSRQAFERIAASGEVITDASVSTCRAGGGPVVTSGLTVSPLGPYLVGDTLTAAFTITNRGAEPVTLATLTAGGRLDGTCPGECPDFTRHADVTLAPGLPYAYTGTLKLARAGTYNFFVAYQLADGAWNTSVPTAAEGIVNSVNIVVTEGPAGPASAAISPGGVVNAASLVSGAVAPGEVVSVFGAGLGPENGVDWRPDSYGRAGAFLADTRLFFDDTPAPLLYAQAGQISAVVPYTISGRQKVQVRAQYRGVPSNVVELAVADSAPGIFTAGGGKGQATILNQDGTRNSPASPAPAGSTVTIYATGGGATVPPSFDGSIISDPPPKLALPVSLTIGGTSAGVVFAGAVPGQVAGMVQVRALVPASLPGGDVVPLVLTIGGRASQPGVTMAIKGAPPPPSAAVTVRGIADIALAGAPEGQRLGNDRSPVNSPLEVPFAVAAGQVVQVEASGFVDVGGSQSPNTSPEGAWNYSPTTQRALGISSIRGPGGALIGVFLGASPPEPNALPPDLDFTGAARDLIVLRPRLQQPFFIGRGRTSSAELKNYVAPAGAARLFLGVLDSQGYNFDNTGLFTVKVGIVPGLAPTIYPRVYGLANIALAGAPEDQRAGYDSSPLQAPVEVPLAIASGQTLQVEASGFVDTGGKQSPDTAPDGAWNYSPSTERAFGISSIRGPGGALIGVFLGPGPPQINALPADLDFTGAARDLIVLRPKLQQPFFIGRGRTSSGESKNYVAPAGATRLLLGVLDSQGYNFDNTGFFVVKAAVVPGPAPQIYPRVYGLANVTLAGAPESQQLGNDSTPLQSPVEVPLGITAGQTVQVEASGFVDARGNQSPDTPPDGAYYLTYNTQRAFGISSIRGPGGALIGVFLGAGAPQMNALPPDVEVTESYRNQGRLQPLLQQPFFIGRGRTPSGEVKKFVAPAGAARLFLGVLDSGGYNYDNTGFFTVTVR